MERRGAQDARGRRHARRHLRLLEPHRGGGEPLRLERTAQPAPLPRGVPRRGDARHPAHGPLVPRRGAQRRPARLALHQGLQDALARQRFPRFHRPPLPPDLHPGAGPSVERRRSGHRGPVRQRIPRPRRIPARPQAHRALHRLRPALLHPHGMARTLHADALRRNAAPLRRLCRRLLGQGR